MAKLKQIIGAVLSDISRARAISDVYSRDLKLTYREDPFLKLLSVPRTDIKEVTLDLKFAILRDQNDAISISRVIIYQEREYQGMCMELSEGGYEIAHLQIYQQPKYYQVENQWNGPSEPWHEGGRWLIGGRTNTNVVAIEASSGDAGKTLNGTMAYSGEGTIGFRANKLDRNLYRVENQLGGDHAPWTFGGNWVIGGRDNQHDQNVTALNLWSTDGGLTLQGSNTYEYDDSPIAFRGKLVEENKKLGSLKVPTGMKVTLYEQEGFKGRALSFTEDTPWVGDDFGNITSSLKVERLPMGDIEAIEVEVVSNQLKSLPEATLSSILIKLDLTSV